MKNNSAAVMEIPGSGPNHKVHPKILAVVRARVPGAVKEVDEITIKWKQQVSE